MPDNFQKNNGMVIFAAVSVTALFLFVFIHSYLSFDPAGPVLPEDRYYLKEDSKDPDPFITKVPNLSDILAGPIISWDDPNNGDEYAQVVITQFSDFVCDFCHSQGQVLKEILAKYPDRVRLIWKDYPESDWDSPSFRAAVAGRCAQEQGQFWPYHDLLYQHNDSLDRETFLKIAETLKLNTKKFADCLENGAEAAHRVMDNMEEATALGISGIPFIYVNQQPVMGEVSFEDLEEMVLGELGEK